MSRERGFTMVELMVSLAMIGTVTAAVFPTLLRTATAARAVDARMEDADAASRARRRIALDLRAASEAALREDALVLSLAGREVVWRAGPRGLTRSAGGCDEDVSRRIHDLAAEVNDGQVNVVLSAPTTQRSLTVGLRAGGAR